MHFWMSLPKQPRHKFKSACCKGSELGPAGINPHFKEIDKAFEASSLINPSKKKMEQYVKHTAIVWQDWEKAARMSEPYRGLQRALFTIGKRKHQCRSKRTGPKDLHQSQLCIKNFLTQILRHLHKDYVMSVMHYQKSYSNDKGKQISISIYLSRGWSASTYHDTPAITVHHLGAHLIY